MTQTSLRELRELRQAFDLFDKDKDGVINLRELKEVMKTLGRDPTEEEIKGKKLSKFHFLKTIF